MDNSVMLEEMLNNANTAIKENRYEDASSILEEIISIDPNFGKAYNHLAYLYDTKFRAYEKAETLYTLCLEKSPEYPPLYYNFAMLLSNLEKWEDLKNLLDKAIHVVGITKSTIYNEYGIMYEQQNKFDTAIEYYKKSALSTIDNNALKRIKTSIDRTKQKKAIHYDL
ncbi:tetratricopeptide (TPR) repeat protein [Mesonia hippocampi]|uniref:Tetratricopeptide (TPR) repeat protein n=1 Tax=Mesonia hippocampi TaxID=1628250 RepID=A0A840ELB0_9FLAO|nr:tetratricopeptide repeat protein [Mesonia hippocampi]MBB4117770.1 tetratricopeptide (TPR) repeat protein [Mesonia hippocampi]